MLLGLIVLSSTVYADPKKGKKIYLKKFKAACGMSGIKFTHTHTQSEWTYAFESGTMKEEILKICPKAKVKDKWIEDIYDFSNKYASDSGNIPSC